MAQKRYFNFKQDDLTFDLSTVNKGILPEGVFAGFDFVATADLNLSLVHTVTGVQFLDADNLTLKSNIGVFRTKQGVVVQEDAPISLPIGSTSSLPRIDLIIARHSFVENSGGDIAQIAVIQGTPNASPVAPALLDADREVILGILTLPANCLQLDQSGVSYVKNDATIFNKQNFDPDTKANQSDLDDKADQTDLDALATVVAGKADASLNYAFTDAANQFTKQQRLAKGADIVAPTQLSLGDSGNFYRVADGNVDMIQAVGVGTEILLRPSGSGFSVRNQQPATAGFKTIIVPSSQDVGLVSTRDTIRLIEDSDGWVVTGMPYSAISVPVGVIAIWPGTIGSIPAGWAWCNGQNGTLDLRAVFPLPTDDATYPTSGAGSTGGAAEVTLTLDELPDFGQQPDSVIARVTGNNTPDALDNSATEIDMLNHTPFPSTGGQAHENMPPYKAVVFMQKIA